MPDRIGRAGLDQPFAWASVTKPLVALAELDAAQRGSIHLDEPAGPPGSTIRHPPSHASGLGPDGDATLSQPGRRRIYSNRGIEIVADILAARSGQPFDYLLADEICLLLALQYPGLQGFPGFGELAPGLLRDLINLRPPTAQPVPHRRGTAGGRDPAGRFPACPACCPASAAQPDCAWVWDLRSRAASSRIGTAHLAELAGHVRSW